MFVYDVGVVELRAAERRPDARDDGVVALSVVHDRVAFGPVDQALDELGPAPRNRDDRVDVGQPRQLDHVPAHCRRAAVHHQRCLDALFDRRPGVRQSQPQVQADGGGHGGEWNRRGVFERHVRRDLERRVCVPDGVFSETAARRQHLVE
jgi:hypothetical protein